MFYYFTLKDLRYFSVAELQPAGRSGDISEKKDVISTARELFSQGQKIQRTSRGFPWGASQGLASKIKATY